MDEPVTIDRRFCGPPDSGNGGYVAGLLASALGDGGCEVTLLRPPPLDRSLRIVRTGDEATLSDGSDTIARGLSAALEFDIPTPPDLAAAREAEQRYTGFLSHPFPNCFVCGPDRGIGDGLRIFPGAIDGQVASSWRPSPDLTDGKGRVRPVFVVAALDCPGYFAVADAAGRALLGRLSVVRYAPVLAGQELIVTGWAIGSDGRKHKAGTALHDGSGRLLAAAQATWITLAATG